MVSSEVELLLAERITVTFRASSPILRTAHTGFFRLATRRGVVSEFGIHFCQAEPEDVYVWDGPRLVRRTLAPSIARVSDATITATLPWDSIPSMSFYPALCASLTLNGGIALPDIHVSIIDRTAESARDGRRDLAPASL